MQRIVNIGKTLRNHWKKSVFFTGVSLWGGNYLNERRIENDLMRAYCKEAVQYGEQKIPALHTSRHVTVILNPAANKRKSKADYEKYCAPILNLAGLKVSIVQTEAEGQAKDLMEIMDNTDCVMIAGGDGTVHEAITGLLRRQDSSRAVKAYPIGIAPVGKRNLIAYRLNNFDKNDRKAKIIGESTMALVREVLKDVSVMKIEGEQGRPVYSLGMINVGQIRNTFSKLNEYWYFGDTAKPYLTFFFQSWRNLSNYWNENENVHVSYTEPCSGCSRCLDKIFPPSALNDNQIVSDPENRRWWHSLLPRSVKPKQRDAREIEIERLKNIDNPNCDRWLEVNLNSKNIMIQNDFESGTLQLLAHDNQMGRLDFIKEGIEFSRSKDYLNNSSAPENAKEKEFIKRVVGKEFKLEMSEFASPEESKPVENNENSDEVSKKEIKEENKEIKEKTNSEKQELSEKQKVKEVLKEVSEKINEEGGVLVELDSIKIPIDIEEKIQEELPTTTGRIGIQEMPDDSSDVKATVLNFDGNNSEGNKEESKVVENSPQATTETDNQPQNNESKKKQEVVNDEVDDSKRWLSIDNENYEISSKLKIELLQRRVQIYAPKFEHHKDHH